ncbi:hypothetical protein SLA2020_334210 [Shorea laevis]
MKKQFYSCAFVLLCIIFLVTNGRQTLPHLQMFSTVLNQTKATLTLNCFEEGCDGGAQSECDNQNHSDDDPIVALQQDDTTRGPPRPYNIVGASKAVWRPLGVPESDWGKMDIYGSDA